MNRGKKIGILMGLATLLVFMACEKGGGSGGSAMQDFLQIHPSAKVGGLNLWNNDFAKYAVDSDDKNFYAQIEIANHGQCYRVIGSIPVSLIEGYDADGQFWQRENLKVQINPKDYNKPKYNSQFVHFAIDQNEKTKVPCPAAPKDSISEDEYRTKVRKTYFSDLPLNERQLAMAGPIFPRGAHTFMLFFKSHNIGLILNSETKELVGLDVPKQILETDYVFTSNRNLLKTDNTPEDEFFPIMITKDDIQTHQRTLDIVKGMNIAIEDMKDKSPQTRDFVLSGTWAQYFKK